MKWWIGEKVHQRIGLRLIHQIPEICTHNQIEKVNKHHEYDAYTNDFLHILKKRPFIKRNDRIKYTEQDQCMSPEKREENRIWESKFNIRRRFRPKGN